MMRWGKYLTVIVIVAIPLVLAVRGDLIGALVGVRSLREQLPSESARVVDNTTTLRAPNAWLNSSAPSPERPKSAIAESNATDEKVSLLYAARSPSDDHLTDQSATEKIVDRTFHVSASVDEACVKLVLFCRNGKALLNALAEEPRDEDWATTTEDLIRKGIARKELPHQTIRALECRSTLCAVEVVSPTEKVRFSADIEYRLMRRDGSFLFGREADKSGIPIWVSVDFFHRK
jgi:hypothetical protein